MGSGADYGYQNLGGEQSELWANIFIGYELAGFEVKVPRFQIWLYYTGSPSAKHLTHLYVYISSSD